MPVNESLLTCDDTELNYQLIKRGYKLLYAPDVVVWHKRRDNPKKFFWQIYRYAVGRVQLAKLHIETLGLSHILFSLFLPIFIFLAVLFLVINPVYFLILSAGVFLPLIIFSFSVLLKEKSFKAFLFAFLVCFIFIFAWFIGFFKELFFPFNNSRSNYS